MRGGAGQQGTEHTAEDTGPPKRGLPCRLRAADGGATGGSPGPAESTWGGGTAHRLPTDFGVLPRPLPSALSSGSTCSDPVLSFCLGAALRAGWGPQGPGPPITQLPLFACALGAGVTPRPERGPRGHPTSPPRPPPERLAQDPAGTRALGQAEGAACAAATSGALAWPVCVQPLQGHPAPPGSHARRRADRQDHAPDALSGWPAEEPMGHKAQAQDRRPRWGGRRAPPQWRPDSWAGTASPGRSCPSPAIEALDARTPTSQGARVTAPCVRGHSKPLSDVGAGECVRGAVTPPAAPGGAALPHAVPQRGRGSLAGLGQ